MSKTICTLYGPNVSSSCGYCHKNPTKCCTWYMETLPLMVSDYNDLIDRGWRRCGNCCYKPINDITCCPSYTIRCDVLALKLTRSQKKILRSVARFLNFGVQTQLHTEDNSRQRDILYHPDSDGNLNKSNESGDKLPNILNFDSKIYNPNLMPYGDNPRPLIVNTSQIHKTSHVKSSKNIKARQKRWINLQKRIHDRSIRENICFEALMEEYQLRRKKRLEKNKPKEIEEYLSFVLPKGQAKHYLEIRLCRSFPPSTEYTSTLGDAHKVYKSYQKRIHNENKESFTLSSFQRFLEVSPLIDVEPAKEDNTNKPLSFGSYHQQYWLDGEKLIAVGVLDILPRCISSVYLFYDPDYSFLNLGTYSALQEIAFTRQLIRTHGPNGSLPHSKFTNFRYYYMGFYIQSCLKMRYKARFYPSYLACPVTYNWVPVEECTQLLDRTKYCRFTPPHVVDTNALSITLKELEEKLTVGSAGQFWPRALFKELKGILNHRYIRIIEDWCKLLGTMCLDDRMIVNL